MTTNRKNAAIMAGVITAGALVGIAGSTPASAHHTTTRCTDQATSTWTIVNSERNTAMTFTSPQGVAGMIAGGGSVSVVYVGDRLQIDAIWSNGQRASNVGEGDCTPEQTTTTTTVPDTTTILPVTVCEDGVLNDDGECVTTDTTTTIDPNACENYPGSECGPNTTTTTITPNCPGTTACVPPDITYPTTTLPASDTEWDECILNGGRVLASGEWKLSQSHESAHGTTDRHVLPCEPLTQGTPGDPDVDASSITSPPTAPSGTLPATGGTGDLAKIAALMLAAGGGALYASRRGAHRPVTAEGES